MSLIEELYNGRIYPSEEIVCHDPKYHAVNNKITEEEEYFKSRISTEDAKRFDEYRNLLMESSCRYAYCNFSHGFRLGSLLMYEVIADSNSPGMQD